MAAGFQQKLEPQRLPAGEHRRRTHHPDFRPRGRERQNIRRSCRRLPPHLDARRALQQPGMARHRRHLRLHPCRNLYLRHDSLRTGRQIHRYHSRDFQLLLALLAADYEHGKHLQQFPEQHGLSGANLRDSGRAGDRGRCQGRRRDASHQGCGFLPRCLLLLRARQGDSAQGFLRRKARYERCFGRSHRRRQEHDCQPHLPLLQRRFGRGFD